MFTKTSKVKFQDQQLDDYVLENSVLKSKLQSKIEALSIMSNELDKCSMERDRYKVLVEQLKCKKKTPFSNEENNVNIYRYMQNNGISGGDLLADTREQNNMLKLEVESLRGRLEEASGDNVALRKQLQLADNCTCNGSSLGLGSNNDYEELVQELEKILKKYQQIQLDYRATLDEKEELVADRDYYKSKVQRLNHQISYILSSRTKIQQEAEGDPPKPIVDIDGLVTENKYLHERITQLQLEKEIIKRTLTKYKTLLENRNNKGDSLNLKKGFIDVMTQKQVREYLDINSKTGLKRTSAAELKSLCLGLFEALNDKSIALQHQRKTNQILANRITELEKTLESWCNGQKYIPIFPSQMLLEEFFPENGLKPDDSKDNDEKPKDNDTNADKVNKIKYSDVVDEEGKTLSDSSSSECKSNESTNEFCENSRLGTKTVLPYELEELVKEALAEMKPGK